MAPMVETEPWASRAKMTGGGMNVLNGDLRLQPQAKNGLLDGKKKPDAVMVLFTASGLTKDFRRRPTLPHSLPCSTIGAEELNFRVRDGNGCDLFAIATEKAV